MAGNDTMRKWVLNSEVMEAVIQSLTESIMAAYHKVRKSSGDEWKIMYQEEKLLRIVMRLNIVSKIPLTASFMGITRDRLKRLFLW